MYSLTPKEQKRLIDAIRAVFAIPFVDDIEDYILEAVFAYTKNIPFIDPLTNIRSKRLFDVVDTHSKLDGLSRRRNVRLHFPVSLKLSFNVQIFSKRPMS
jgi:hypothetical protein